MAGGHGTWNLGTSEPRNLVWRPNVSKRASGALLKFSFTTSIWSRDPRTWNLEPPLRPPLAPPTAEPGTWNLDPGTWNLEPTAKNSKIAPAARVEPGTSEPGTSYLLTRDTRNRNLGTLSGVEAVATPEIGRRARDRAPSSHSASLPSGCKHQEVELSKAQPSHQEVTTKVFEHTKGCHRYFQRTRMTDSGPGRPGE